MYATEGAGERARWSVVWISKGKMVRKDYDGDFAEAVRIYTLAVKADKANATLVCVNMSFPPPDKYADHEDVIVYKDGKRYKGKRVILPRVYRSRMGSLNRKGIFWCPFCVKARKFVKYDAFMLDGIQVDEAQLSCPMCGISHNHGAVRKYNPYAIRGPGRRTRSDKGSSRG